MNNEEDHGSEVSGRNVKNSKIARIIDEYGLDGVGDALEERWTAEENRHSLRELANWFNRQVLRAAMEDAGQAPLDGEIETFYRTLHDGDTSGGARVRMRKRLERHGIDVERIRDDFVSHQAVHTYLTKYREASHTPESAADRAERRLETVQRLQSRTAAVTRTAIEQLEAADEIEAHDVDVFVDIRVLCPKSGTQYAFRDFVENGGCADE